MPALSPLHFKAMRNQKFAGLQKRSNDTRSWKDRKRSDKRHRRIRKLVTCKTETCPKLRRGGWCKGYCVSCATTIHNLLKPEPEKPKKTKQKKSEHPGEHSSPSSARGLTLRRQRSLSIQGKTAGSNSSGSGRGMAGHIPSSARVHNSREGAVVIKHKAHRITACSDVVLGENPSRK